MSKQWKVQAWRHQVVDAYIFADSEKEAQARAEALDFDCYTEVEGGWDEVNIKTLEIDK